MRASTSKELNWKDGSSLINDSPHLITHLATERFIECIQDARHDGYGFVPFIGAGFSAPSGAPLVRLCPTLNLLFAIPQNNLKMKQLIGRNDCNVCRVIVIARQQSTDTSTAHAFI
jgi:hypothetical protein